MPNETVRVGVEFTQNIGNYENIRTVVHWEGAVRTDEDHEEATDRLYEGLEPKFLEKAQEVYNSMSDKARKETQIVPKE